MKSVFILTNSLVSIGAISEIPQICIKVISVVSVVIFFSNLSVFSFYWIYLLPFAFEPAFCKMVLKCNVFVGNRETYL